MPYYLTIIRRRRNDYAPINVKPQGGGGGATPGELIINDATSLGNLTILTGPRVGKFDIAAILNNWNNFRLSMRSFLNSCRSSE